MNIENDSSSNETSTPDSSGIGLRTAVALVIIVFLIWCVSAVAILSYFANLESASKFGDVFGAINALFSGLALGGVVLAIFLQRQELELQRYELKMTRTELKRSAVAQERSEDALVRQAVALTTTASLEALNLLPILTCDLIVDNKQNVSMVISNHTNVHALGVNLKILSFYWCGIGDTKNIDDFVENHVEAEFGFRNDFKSADDGFFGVKDNTNIHILPAQKKWIGRLNCPSGSLVTILIQFRDVQGSNFHQVFSFGGDENIHGDVSGYTLYDVKPNIITSFSRVEFAGENDRYSSRTPFAELISSDGSPLPAHLVGEEFKEYYDCFLSVEFLKGADVSWGRKGEVFDINYIPMLYSV